MDQQFEEMNNKLNSVTDPTGFLRMVRRNNLFNRYAGLARSPCGQGALSTDPVPSADAPSSWSGSGLCRAFVGVSVTLPRPHAPQGLSVTAAPLGQVRQQGRLAVTICVWLGWEAQGPAGHFLTLSRS